MRHIIVVKYKCRSCQEMFERSTEYLDNFFMSERMHQMHECNRKAHDEFPKTVKLRCGLGDLVGYTIVGAEGGD
jgi:hypothetical protein